MRTQVICRTNAGEHEQLRRVDRSATEQHTAPSLHLADPPLVQVGHAGDLVALDHESGDARISDGGEIGSPESRFEICIGGAVTFSILLCDLKKPDTLLRSAVEIVIASVTHSNPRFDKCAGERI